MFIRVKFWMAFLLVASCINAGWTLHESLTVMSASEAPHNFVARLNFLEMPTCASRTHEQMGGYLHLMELDAGNSTELTIALYRHGTRASTLNSALTCLPHREYSFAPISLQKKFTFIPSLLKLELRLRIDLVGYIPLYPVQLAPPSTCNKLLNFDVQRRGGYMLHKTITCHPYIRPTS
jgi:hypothetical protein